MFSSLKHHPAQILIVDDELPIRTTLADILRRRGYKVTIAVDGQEAMALIVQQSFDLLLLDLTMPGLSGIEVAQRAKAHQPDLAIIILTGHGSLETVLEGMHLSIFDYLLKTVSPQEVVARVATALEQQQQQRRQQQLVDALHTVVNQLQDQTEPQELARPPAMSEAWIVVGDLQISTWRQTARLGGRTLPLTPTEFRILACLAQQAGQVMSYQQMLHHVQGYEVGAVEAAELIKPHIYHLRQKLETDPANPHYLLTVRGTGYLLSIQTN